MRERRNPKETKPMAIIIPTAATNQMVAAVVIPVICSPVLRMTPAPRKPTPVTIPAATRMGSLGGLEPVKSCQAMIEARVKRADPVQMKMLVLSPAGFPAYSLSSPRRAPQRAATRSLVTTRCCLSIAISCPKAKVEWNQDSSGFRNSFNLHPRRMQADRDLANRSSLRGKYALNRCVVTAPGR